MARRTDPFGPAETKALDAWSAMEPQPGFAAGVVEQLAPLPVPGRRPSIGWVAAAAGALVVGLIIGFVLGRDTSPEPQPVLAVGTSEADDAMVEEVERLRSRVRALEDQLERVDVTFADPRPVQRRDVFIPPAAPPEPPPQIERVDPRPETETPQSGGAGSECSGSAAKISVMAVGATDCTVVVGRSRLGAAPIFKKRAPTGRCEVRIECGDGKSYRTTITIEPGSSEKVIVKPGDWR